MAHGREHLQTCEKYHQSQRVKIRFKRGATLNELVIEEAKSIKFGR